MADVVIDAFTPFPHNRGMRRTTRYIPRRQSPLGFVEYLSAQGDPARGP
jgi:hypothetical protein